MAVAQMTVMFQLPKSRIPMYSSVPVFLLSGQSHTLRTNRTTPIMRPQSLPMALFAQAGMVNRHHQPAVYMAPLISGGLNLLLFLREHI